jgi:5-methyltetrahydrofolate--homocysteine methyltransferase
VLQSAEVMKAAVAYLEPFMEKTSDAAKGRMLLATVKGDVHDIGKNLVDIILSNNGYEVVNLGIKVPAQTIITAAREHRPDFIGLSGLLVKSAQEMVATADELREAGIDVPILVGGAALTERFTYGRIASAYAGPSREAGVFYARDAMSGLDLANKLTDPRERPALFSLLADKRAELAAEKAAATSEVVAPGPNVPERGPLIVTHGEVPRPPDLKRHVRDDIRLEEVWPFINPMMLYTRHLGLKGRLDTLIAAGDEKAIELKKTVKSLEDDILAGDWLQARAVWRFVRAARVDGEDTVVFSDSNGELGRVAFPRERRAERRSLTDLVPTVSSGKVDHVAFFVTSCQGKGLSVRERADQLKQQGAFVRMHALQAIAIETAEALAEWLHKTLRTAWGFPDAPSTSMQDLFSARYRGRRYSFGYPACPNLEDQALVWKILEPEQTIGVTLTDGFMMDPEASVSAMVFHHPQATYFDARPVDD